MCICVLVKVRGWFCVLSLMSDTLHFLSPVPCLEARRLKLLSVAVTNTMTESNVERKGFIFAHSPSVCTGTPGWTLWMQEVDVIEEFCLLGLLSWQFGLLFYI